MRKARESRSEHQKPASVGTKVKQILAVGVSTTDPKNILVRTYLEHGLLILREGVLTDELDNFCELIF